MGAVLDFVSKRRLINQLSSVDKEIKDLKNRRSEYNKDESHSKQERRQEKAVFNRALQKLLQRKLQIQKELYALNKEEQANDAAKNPGSHEFDEVLNKDQEGLIETLDELKSTTDAIMADSRGQFRDLTKEQTELIDSDKVFSERYGFDDKDEKDSFDESIRYSSKNGNPLMYQSDLTAEEIKKVTEFNKRADDLKSVSVEFHEQKKIMESIEKDRELIGSEKKSFDSSAVYKNSKENVEENDNSSNKSNEELDAMVDKNIEMTYDGTSESLREKRDAIEAENAQNVDPQIMSTYKETKKEIESAKNLISRLEKKYGSFINFQSIKNDLNNSDKLLDERMDEITSSSVKVAKGLALFVDVLSKFSEVNVKLLKLNEEFSKIKESEAKKKLDKGEIDQSEYDNVKDKSEKARDEYFEDYVKRKVAISKTLFKFSSKAWEYSKKVFRNIESQEKELLDRYDDIVKDCGLSESDFAVKNSKDRDKLNKFNKYLDKFKGENPKYGELSSEVSNINEKLGKIVEAREDMQELEKKFIEGKYITADEVFDTKDEINRRISEREEEIKELEEKRTAIQEGIQDEKEKKKYLMSSNREIERKKGKLAELRNCEKDAFEILDEPGVIEKLKKHYESKSLEAIDRHSGLVKKAASILREHPKADVSSIKKEMKNVFKEHGEYRKKHHRLVMYEIGMSSRKRNAKGTENIKSEAEPEKKTKVGEFVSDLAAAGKVIYEDGKSFLNKKIKNIRQRVDDARQKRGAKKLAKLESKQEEGHSNKEASEIESQDVSNNVVESESKAEIKPSKKQKKGGFFGLFSKKQKDVVSEESADKESVVESKADVEEEIVVESGKDEVVAESETIVDEKESKSGVEQEIEENGDSKNEEREFKELMIPEYLNKWVELRNNVNKIKTIYTIINETNQKINKFQSRGFANSVDCINLKKTLNKYVDIYKGLQETVYSDLNYLNKNETKFISDTEKCQTTSTNTSKSIINEISNLDIEKELGETLTLVEAVVENGETQKYARQDINKLNQIIGTVNEHIGTAASNLDFIYGKFNQTNNNDIQKVISSYFNKYIDDGMLNKFKLPEVDKELIAECKQILDEFSVTKIKKEESADKESVVESKGAVEEEIVESEEVSVNKSETIVEEKESKSAVEQEIEENGVEIGVSSEEIVNANEKAEINNSENLDDEKGVEEKYEDNSVLKAENSRNKRRIIAWIRRNTKQNTKESSINNKEGVESKEEIKEDPVQTDTSIEEDKQQEQNNKEENESKPIIELVNHKKRGFFRKNKKETEEKGVLKSSKEIESEESVVESKVEHVSAEEVKAEEINKESKIVESTKYESEIVESKEAVDNSKVDSGKGLEEKEVLTSKQPFNQGGSRLRLTPEQLKKFEAEAEAEVKGQVSEQEFKRYKRSKNGKVANMIRAIVAKKKGQALGRMAEERNNPKIEEQEKEIEVVEKTETVEIESEETIEEANVQPEEENKPVERNGLTEYISAYAQEYSKFYSTNTGSRGSSMVDKQKRLNNGMRNLISKQTEKVSTNSEGELNSDMMKKISHPISEADMADLVADEKAVLRLFAIASNDGYKGEGGKWCGLTEKRRIALAGVLIKVAERKMEMENKKAQEAQMNKDQELLVEGAVKEYD